MKKIIIFIVVVLIIILSIIGIRYCSYKVEYDAIKQENSIYEKYKDTEISGLDVATLINKSVDKNEKNKIQKNDKNEYIQNEENSIEIEVYMKNEDETYQIKMETIYDNGTEQFVQYCGNLMFKCSRMEYHKRTGKISYILFEQI